MLILTLLFGISSAMADWQSGPGDITGGSVLNNSRYSGNGKLATLVVITGEPAKTLYRSLDKKSVVLGSDGSGEAYKSYTKYGNQYFCTKTLNRSLKRDGTRYVSSVSYECQLTVSDASQGTFAPYQKTAEWLRSRPVSEINRNLGVTQDGDSDMYP